MNDYRYVYVVMVADPVSTRYKVKHIKCAFKTRPTAQKWIERFNKKEASLVGGSKLTNLKIKQILLYNKNDL